jgi:hypothetical protein
VPSVGRYLVTLDEVSIDAETFDGATAESIAAAMKHTSILDVIHAQTLAMEVSVSLVPSMALCLSM